MNCILHDSVSSCSCRSWQNVAVALNCLCVQRRTDEGVVKGRSLYNRYFRYVSCDYSLYRIIYSTNPIDFVAECKRHHWQDNGSERFVLAVADDFGDVMEAYALILDAWKAIFMRKNVGLTLSSPLAQKGFFSTSENEEEANQEDEAEEKSGKKKADDNMRQTRMNNAMRTYLPNALHRDMSTESSSSVLSPMNQKDPAAFLPFSQHRWVMLVDYLHSREEGGGHLTHSQQDLKKWGERMEEVEEGKGRRSERSGCLSSMSSKHLSSSTHSLSDREEWHSKEGGEGPRVAPRRSSFPPVRHAGEEGQYPRPGRGEEVSLSSRASASISSTSTEFFSSHLHSSGAHRSPCEKSPEAVGGRNEGKLWDDSPPPKVPSRTAVASAHQPTSRTPSLIHPASPPPPPESLPSNFSDSPLVYPSKGGRAEGSNSASSTRTKTSKEKKNETAEGREVSPRRRKTVSQASSHFSSSSSGSDAAPSNVFSWKRISRYGKGARRARSHCCHDIPSTLPSSLSRVQRALSVQLHHPMDRGLSLFVAVLFIGSAALLTFMWCTMSSQTSTVAMGGHGVATKSSAQKGGAGVSDTDDERAEASGGGKLGGAGIHLWQGEEWEGPGQLYRASYPPAPVDSHPSLTTIGWISSFLLASPWSPLFLFSTLLMLLSGCVLFFYRKGDYPERKLSRRRALTLSVRYPPSSNSGWQEISLPRSLPSLSEENTMLGGVMTRVRSWLSLGLKVMADHILSASSPSYIPHLSLVPHRRRRSCRRRLATPSRTVEEEQLLIQLQNYGAPYSSILLRPLRGWNATPGTAGWSDTWRFKDFYFSERSSPFSSSSWEIRVAINIPHTSMGTLQSLLLRPYYPEVSGQKGKKRKFNIISPSPDSTSPSTGSRSPHDHSQTAQFPNFLFPLCTEMEIVKRLEHNICIARTVEHSRVFGVPPAEIYTYVSPAILLDIEQQKELHLRHPFTSSHPFSPSSSSSSFPAGYVYLCCSVHCPMEDIRAHLSLSPSFSKSTPSSPSPSSATTPTTATATVCGSEGTARPPSSTADHSCLPLQRGTLHHQVWMGFEEGDGSLTLAVYRSLALPSLAHTQAVTCRKTVYRSILHTVCRVVRVLQQLGPMPNELRGYRNHSLYIPFWTSSCSASGSDSSSTCSSSSSSSSSSRPRATASAGTVSNSPPPPTVTEKRRKARESGGGGGGKRPTDFSPPSPSAASNPCTRMAHYSSHSSLQPPPGIHWSSSIQCTADLPTALEPLGGLAGRPLSPAAAEAGAGVPDSDSSPRAQTMKKGFRSASSYPLLFPSQDSEAAAKISPLPSPHSRDLPMSFTLPPTSSPAPPGIGVLPSPLVRFLERITMKNVGNSQWNLICDEQEKGLKIFRGNFETSSIFGMEGGGVSTSALGKKMHSGSGEKKWKQLKTEVYFPFQSLDAMELEIMTDFMFPSFGFEVSRRLPLETEMAPSPIRPAKIGLMPVETVFKVRGAEHVLSPRCLTWELLEGLHFTVRQLEEALPTTLWNELVFLHHLEPNTCMFFYGGEGGDNSEELLSSLSALERPLCIDVPSYGFLCWKSSYVADECVSHLGASPLPSHSTSPTRRSTKGSVAEGRDEDGGGDRQSRSTGTSPSSSNTSNIDNNTSRSRNTNIRYDGKVFSTWSPSADFPSSMRHPSCETYPAPLNNSSTLASTAGGVRMIAMVEYGWTRPFHWSSEWNYQAKQMMHIKAMVEVITAGCAEYFSHSK